MEVAIRVLGWVMLAATGVLAVMGILSNRSK
jgi:hypothetical protein